MAVYTLRGGFIKNKGFVTGTAIGELVLTG
jgi:hypothetical protein